MSIQLYVGARGKTRGGKLVEIVRKADCNAYPWQSDSGLTYDDNGSFHTGINTQADIIELLPPRQYVDTPFEVGKTYPTRDGTRKRKVVGFALATEDENGIPAGRRGLDGSYFAAGPSDNWDIIPTPIEGKPKQTVTLELTDEQLAKVREALK